MGNKLKIINWWYKEYSWGEGGVSLKLPRSKMDWLDQLITIKEVVLFNSLNFPYLRMLKLLLIGGNGFIKRRTYEKANILINQNFSWKISWSEIFASYYYLYRMKVERFKITNIKLINIKYFKSLYLWIFPM